MDGPARRLRVGLVESLEVSVTSVESFSSRNPAGIKIDWVLAPLNQRTESIAGLDPSPLTVCHSEFEVLALDSLRRNATSLLLLSKFDA